MQRAVVEWTDVDLAWLRTAWSQLDGTSADALVTALLAHSTGAIRERTLGPRTIVNGVAAGGNWSSLLDIASLDFCTAAGNMVKLQLPAPAAGIFLPSGFEVDYTKIADIITAALAVLCDTGGQPVVSFGGGSLVHRRRDQQ
jgi:hypothetical protein